MRISRLRLLSPLLVSVVAVAALAAAPAGAGQGRWTPVGPGKGRFVPVLSSVAVDPTAPGTVWAGLAFGGLYESDDHGATWRWASRPLAGDRGVLAVTPDPAAAGALWAATATAVYHTADHGAHWTRLTDESWTAALAGDEPLWLGVVPGADPTFYVRVSRRLLASADGGRSWRTVLAAGDDGFVLQAAVVPGPAPALYAHTYDGEAWHLLASADGGASWQPLVCPVPAATGIERIWASRGALYVLPVEEQKTGLLASRDGGRTWRAILGGGPGLTFGLDTFAIDPSSPRTLWAIGGTARQGTALLLSRDGGATWHRRPRPPYQGRLLAGADDALYLVNDGGLARSLDGGWTWSLGLAIPSDESPPSRIAFDPAHASHQVLTVGHRQYETFDGAVHWRLLSSPAPYVNDLWIDPTQPGRWVAAGGAGRSRSTDGGRTWTLTSSSYTELLVGGEARTLWAGGCGVDVSRDGGRTWSESLACTGPDEPRAGRYVQKIEVDPRHPGTVYALTFLDGDFYPNHGPMNGQPSFLWRSRDGGRTWLWIANEIDAFALDHVTSRLFVSRGTDLFVSDDGGHSWGAGPPLPSAVTDLARPDGTLATLYAAASPALLVSRDDGRTWESFDQGIDPGAYLLRLHPRDGRTVYALSRLGVFHMAVP